MTSVQEEIHKIKKKCIIHTLQSVKKGIHSNAYIIYAQQLYTVSSMNTAWVKICMELKDTLE